MAMVGAGGLGVEAQANATEPYMIGMIQAIRAIDPNILTELSDVYADEMCGKSEQRRRRSWRTRRPSSSRRSSAPEGASSARSSATRKRTS